MSAASITQHAIYMKAVWKNSNKQVFKATGFMKTINIMFKDVLRYIFGSYQLKFSRKRAIMCTYKSSAKIYHGLKKKDDETRCVCETRMPPKRPFFFKKCNPYI